MDIIRNMEIIENSRDVNVYFCQFTDEYISYCPTISIEVANEIKQISIAHLSRVETVDQEYYNPSGALTNTVEFCAFDEYRDVQVLIDSFNVPSIGRLEPQEVSFFVYEFINEGNSIYAIRRHNKINSIRRGFIGNFLRNQFTKIEEENIFGIDDQIDLLISGDEILIINHTSFERVFNITNEFVERAERVLESEELEAHIVNYNQFKEDLLSNMNYVKRVSKLNEDDGAFRFLYEPETVRGIIDRFNLGIEIDEEGKYIYQDKSQVGELINFMQDSYYETLIHNELGVNERGN